MQEGIDHYLMTMFIFALGTITVTLSIAVALRFHRYQKALQSRAKRLTVAISWQLWGEAIIGFGTLAFSAAAHYGWLDHWSMTVQSVIRFIMFFATASTTFHLSRTLMRMSQK